MYSVHCAVYVVFFGICWRSKEEGGDEAKHMCAHAPSCDKTGNTLHYITRCTLLTVHNIHYTMSILYHTTDNSNVHSSPSEARRLQCHLAAGGSCMHLSLLPLLHLFLLPPILPILLPPLPFVSLSSFLPSASFSASFLLP